MDKEIRDAYYNPAEGFISAQKLYEKLRKRFPQVRLQDIKAFLEKQEVAQVFHRPNPHMFQSIVAPSPRDNYQMDLLDVSDYAFKNGGIRYLMNIVDVNSRFAYSAPLKTKGTMEVLEAFKRAIETLGKPKSLTSDLEGAVMSKEFQSFLDREGIKHFAVDPAKKRNTAIVERFNRTLREILRKYFFARDTNSYIEALPALIENYNNTLHSTTGETPMDVFTGKKVNRQTIDIIWNSGFEIGDRVRYQVNDLGLFGKASSSNTFTQTIYTIVSQEGRRFVIEDSHGSRQAKLPSELLLVEEVQSPPIQKSEASQELSEQKRQRRTKRLMDKEGVKAGDVLIEGRTRSKAKRIIEEFLEKRGDDEYLVSWKGYKLSESTWESRASLERDYGAAAVRAYAQEFEG